MLMMSLRSVKSESLPNGNCASAPPKMTTDMKSARLSPSIPRALGVDGGERPERAAAPDRLGRLLQAAFRGTRTGAALPVARYTHRVAISNRRLVAADDGGIAFRWKDYRIEGANRWKTMTLHPHEFIRRFLVHVLPKGLQRIRQYGLFANGNRTANIARRRELLGVPAPEAAPETPPASEPDHPSALPCPCPRCGGRMIVIEIFERSMTPRHRASPFVAVIRIDTS